MLLSIHGAYSSNLSHDFTATASCSSETELAGIKSIQILHPVFPAPAERV
jgi:hypothetical protein